MVLYSDGGIPVGKIPQNQGGNKPTRYRVGGGFLAIMPPPLHSFRIPIALAGAIVVAYDVDGLLSMKQLKGISLYRRFARVIACGNRISIHTC